MIDLRQTYLFGAHVYRVPAASMDNVLADLATMKKLGLNLANIQVSWSWSNPRAGEYDFSEPLAIVERAKSLDMLASITLTLEQAPKWVWDKYADSPLLNAYNQPHNDPTQYCMPGDGKPGPCWDHEGVLREMETFLAAAAKAMQPHENMVYWNVWQEIGLWSQMSGATRSERFMPYNPQTIAKFRVWLKKKYASLEALNAAWRTRFGNWDEIDPPRMYYCVPSFPDWFRYIHEGYLAGAVESRTQALRKADAHHRPVAFHTAAPYFGMAYEFVWSKAVDMYGTSFYPTVQHGIGWEHPKLAAGEDGQWRHELLSSLFQMNYSRCATGRDRVFLMSELAAGRYNGPLTVRGDVSKDDMRHWLSLQLAAGSQGAVLWNTRPEHFWAEAQGQGFLDGDGHLTPRCEEIARFAAGLSRHGSALAGTPKQTSNVAIALDDELFNIAAGGDMGQSVTFALRGACAACIASGIDPDFVDVARNDDKTLAGYRAILLAFPFVMSDALCAKLRRYVESGGTILAGPTPARFDEYGMASLRWLSPAAEELFGVRHETIQQVAEFGHSRRWSPGEGRPCDFVPATALSGTGPLAGLSPKAALFLQTFKPFAAEGILEWDGRCVGAVRRLGKGQAVVFGTQLFYSILGEACADSQSALERLLAQARVQGDRQGAVIRQRRELGDDRELWFLINLTAGQQEYVLGDLSAPAEDFFAASTVAPGATLNIAGRDIVTLVVNRK